MTDAPIFKAVTGQPSGLGGWLVLPLIGLVLAPLMMVKLLLFDIFPAFQPEKWEQFTSVGSPIYSSYWAPYLIISMFVTLTLAIWSSILFFMFIRRKRQIPFLMSLFYLATAAAALFEFLSIQHLVAQVPALADPEVTRRAQTGLVRGLVALAVWVPYFRTSVRVRNTFVS